MFEKAYVDSLSCVLFPGQGLHSFVLSYDGDLGHDLILQLTRDALHGLAFLDQYGVKHEDIKRNYNYKLSPPPAVKCEKVNPQRGMHIVAALSVQAK